MKKQFLFLGKEDLEKDDDHKMSSTNERTLNERTNEENLF